MEEISAEDLVKGGITAVVLSEKEVLGLPEVDGMRLPKDELESEVTAEECMLELEAIEVEEPTPV